MQVELRSHRLKDHRVNLTVLEPWAFGTEFGERPVPCRVIDVDQVESPRHALLEVIQPFMFQSLRYRRLLASPRHQGAALDDLITVGSVTCNIARVPEDPLGAERFAWKPEWYSDVGLIAHVVLDENPD